MLKGQKILLVLLLWRTLAAAQTLEFVKFLNAPGHFTTGQSVAARHNYIFAVSTDGRMFIYGRAESVGFPLVATIQVSSFSLLAVTVDPSFVYVADAVGMLHKFHNMPPFTLAEAASLSDIGLTSLALVQGTICTARGQGVVAASLEYFYLSPLNPGEDGLCVLKSDLTMTGPSFIGTPFVTTAFYRVDTTTSGGKVTAGTVKAEAPNPLDVLGRPSQVFLYPFTFRAEKFLVQTIPGCCGSGIYLLDQATLVQKQYIGRLFVDGISFKLPSSLIAGTEDGHAMLYDLSIDPARQLSDLNLGGKTGLPFVDAFEVRAVWCDSNADGLCFVGSSGTYANIPAFAVLRVAQK